MKDIPHFKRWDLYNSSGITHENIVDYVESILGSQTEREDYAFVVTGYPMAWNTLIEDSTPRRLMDGFSDDAIFTSIKAFLQKKEYVPAKTMVGCHLMLESTPEYTFQRLYIACWESGEQYLYATEFYFDERMIQREQK